MSASAPEPADGVRDPAGVTDSIQEDRVEEQQARQERIQLDGRARELFLNRYTDTFTVERHGTEIEFHRPVDGTVADLESIREEKPDLGERLERGSQLLKEFEDVHAEMMRKAMDDSVPAEELAESGRENTRLTKEIMSLHAADESFRDPGVWAAVFPKEDDIVELWQDFISEGSPEERREKLETLQNLRSGGLSET